jgi:chaperonin GroES
MPKEPKRRRANDLTNLAFKIPAKTLEALGRQVVENYDADEQSRSEWSKRRASWIKLFTGHRDEKTFPWPKSANVCVPMLSTAALQFNARALPSLMPPKDIVKPYAIDGSAINIAKRKAKYLNWQLGYSIPNYRAEMDRLLIQLPIYGSAYKKTYYDYYERKIISKTLPVEEVVTPYKYKRFEDCPRITHKFFMELNDIRKRASVGAYVNTDDFQETLGPAVDEADSTVIRDEVDKYEGVTESTESIQPRLLLEQHLDYELDGSGFKKPYIVTVDNETRRVLRVMPREIEVGDIVHKLSFFTLYTFIPSPESHYGIGFGHLLEHINETGNTIINQLIDAGTLQNTKGGFVSRRGGMKRGSLCFRMGEFKELELPVEDIRKQIMPLEFSPPSQALFNLLQMLQDYSQRVSSVSETMMGEAPPSDTTATTMMAIMEQGMSMFSTIHARVHDVFTQEIRKIEKLNSIHLDTLKYVQVQDSTSEEYAEIEKAHQRVGEGQIPAEELETLLKGDFMVEHDVIPTSNPNITSRAEKLAKANEVYEMARQNPLMQDADSMYEASVGKLKALEVQNVASYIKRPQPPQPPPDKPPEQENADFLKEVGSAVLPQQDHPAHWESHESFRQSQWYDQLTPHGKKLLDQHMMETLSEMYAKEARGEEANPIQFDGDQEEAAEQLAPMQ